VVLSGHDHVAHLGRYSRYRYMPAAVLLGVDGELELLVFSDEAEAARELARADLVTTYGEHGFGLDRDPAATMAAAMEERRRERFGGAPVAFEADVAAALAEIRLVKDADERALVARAFQLALVGQRTVEEAAREGVSEIELFSIAQHAAQVACGEPVEFACDLLVGPRSAQVCWPVAVAGPTRAAAGDVVVADVSVRAGGYWGDTARTYIVGDNVGAAGGLEALNEILDEAAKLLVPGMTGHAVHAAVSRLLSERFPDGEFPHHAGHGIGLGGFEDPHLVPGDGLPFAEGMLIAVEPGIYFEGRYGLRVENVYAVTPEGGVPLG